MGAMADSLRTRPEHQLDSSRRAGFPSGHFLVFVQHAVLEVIEVLELADFSDTVVER